MALFDTHFHLDLTSNPSELADIIEGRKIYTIAVTNAPSVFPYSYELGKNKKYVRAALGLHPELVYERASEISSFKKYLPLTRYVGEVGLDYSRRNLKSQNKQKEVFQKILTACAESGDKILTIHSRKAEDDVIEMIGNKFPGKIILHWYSGSIQTLKKALDYGFYFSVNYPMTQSKSGQRILSNIPVNRLLIETDGPFTKMNENIFDPLMVSNILDRLSNHLQMLPKELENTLFKNFGQIIK